MDIKKENPSKVIIVPRPPRSNNEQWVPINGASSAVTAEPVNGAVETAPANLEFVDPGIGDRKSTR